MSPDSETWPTPPPHLTLESDEVHVWLAKLDQPEEILRGALSSLSPDERQRAERFRFRKDRDHFIIARGTLRAILARYLQLEPRALRFDYSRYGKPALAQGTHVSPRVPLHFNLSHSHELALFAFALNREVGLDLEFIRDDFAGEEIAGRFFSRREVEMLCALPSHLRGVGFFNCWTRKEAYIKAIGEGLSMPLDQFDVSLAPGEPAALLRTLRDESEASRWSLKELKPGAGYAAAIAVEGHDWRLKRWLWTGEDTKADVPLSASHIPPARA